MDMANGQQLTLKQHRWLKEYLKCGNATEAAVRVYNVKNRDSANAIGAQNLAKIDFDKLLDANGLTLAQMLKAIVEGLNATKKVWGNGKSIEVPDYSVRFDYLITCLKLRNIYPFGKRVKAYDSEKLAKIKFT